MELDSSIYTTGTSHEDLSFILRIKIQQNLTIKEPWLKRHSTIKTCLLSCCEQTLDLSKREITVQKCKLSRNTDTAVSTKRSIRSYHPTILDHILYRILGKIMLYSLILLTDHIRVALQYDCRNILMTWSRLLYDQDIACLVCTTFKISVSCEFLKVCYNLLFVT